MTGAAVLALGLVAAGWGTGDVRFAAVNFAMLVPYGLIIRYALVCDRCGKSPTWWTMTHLNAGESMNPLALKRCPYCQFCYPDHGRE